MKYNSIKSVGEEKKKKKKKYKHTHKLLAQLWASFLSFSREHNAAEEDNLSHIFL